MIRAPQGQFIHSLTPRGSLRTQYVRGHVSALLGAPREKPVRTRPTVTLVRANDRPVKAVGQDGGSALDVRVKRRDELNWAWKDGPAVT